MKPTDANDVRQAISLSGIQEHAHQALDRITARVAELEMETRHDRDLIRVWVNYAQEWRERLHLPDGVDVFETLVAERNRYKDALLLWTAMMENPNYDLGEMANEFDRIVLAALNL